MFRDVVEKGKIWADKIATAVLNYSELEAKVREATSDEPWGPHGRILNDLARESYDYEGLSEIMNILWTRIFPENSRNWRRMYKALTVLIHLLRNGSEKVLDMSRDHLYDLRTLDSYQCIDERGRDQGAGIRQKAREVVELIQDTEFLQAEREKARTERKDYRGFGNTKYDYDFPSNRMNNYDSPEDDSYHFPRRDPVSTGQMFSKPNSPIESQLGSFEAWKVGRERGVGDEVIEKLSSAMRVVKTVSDDFFGVPRVPPPSAHEENPHQVSEDVFTFPDAQLEKADENEDRWYREQYSNFQSNEHSGYVSTPPRPQQQKKSVAAVPKIEEPGPPPLIDLGRARDAHQTQTPPSGVKLPRPPSVELLTTSLEKSVFNKQEQASVDLFADFDKSQHQSQNNGFFADQSITTHVANSNCPTPSNLFDGLATVQAPTKPSVTPVTSDACDADFWDFASAQFEVAVRTESQPTVNPVVSPTHAFSAFPSHSSSVVIQATKPSTTTVDNPHSKPVLHEAQPVVSCNCAKSNTSVIGKTWKDFDALSLDLDFRIKTGPVKSAAPSLAQLQSQRNINVMAPVQTLKSPASSNSENFADFDVFK